MSRNRHSAAPRVSSSFRSTRITWIALGVTLVAVALAAISGFGHRWGWWHFSTGFQVLRWAVYLAMAGGALAIVALIAGVIRRRASDLTPAAATLLIAAAAILVPALWMNTARSVPPIHDITTDTLDPPAFEAILPLREGASNPPDYAGEEVAAEQRAVYPDIVPLEVDAPPADTFAAALAAAHSMGWEVVAADPARGRIEAVDTTFWFGFKDDVVIRVTPIAGGSRIDVRSKSRVGRSDAGTNAARIRQYLNLLGR